MKSQIIICNFTPVPRYKYRVGVPYEGKYEEVFNSDLEEFGGSGVKNETLITSEKQNWHNQPYSIEVEIPPLGALFLKLRNKKENRVIEDIEDLNIVESRTINNNNSKNCFSITKKH